MIHSNEIYIVRSAIYLQVAKHCRKSEDFTCDEEDFVEFCLGCKLA